MLFYYKIKQKSISRFVRHHDTVRAMKLSSELHCHSNYSKDCNLSIDTIIHLCTEHSIGVIALTDHNEIAGAVELQQKAPKNLQVILGEEIATAQGDLIGLFLKEYIAPRQDIAKTIDQIHSQGGLALLPHPFDRLRREAVGKMVTRAVAERIDFIEIFNARCVFSGDNTHAKQFAKEHNIPAFVGSDAHLPREYGNALNLIESFTDAISFKKSLASATFTTKAAGIGVHINTKLVKLSKRDRY